jgi:hypothetical protein
MVQEPISHISILQRTQENERQGNHTLVYRYRTSFMSLEANSYSFLFPANTMTATSARHKTANSKAFLNNPFFRFKNVTYTKHQRQYTHPEITTFAGKRDHIPLYSDHP